VEVVWGLPTKQLTSALMPIVAVLAFVVLTRISPTALLGRALRESVSAQGLPAECKAGTSSGAEPLLMSLRRGPRIHRVLAPTGLAAGDVPFNPAVMLQAFGGLQWLGQVELGVPRQLFNVTLDTGSSDLLVVGPHCKPQGCMKHPSSVYNPNASKCFQACRESCIVQDNYGGGTVAGVWGNDTVELGGLRSNNFCFGIIGSLTLEGANSEIGWDGILGLTFVNRQPNRPMTFLSSLVAQKMLTARIFTFRLLDPPYNNLLNPFGMAANDDNPPSSAARPHTGEGQPGDDAVDPDQVSMFELGGMTMVPRQGGDGPTKKSGNVSIVWAPLINR
jgi:hypothetical protein